MRRAGINKSIFKKHAQVTSQCAATLNFVPLDICTMVDSCKTVCASRRDTIAPRSNHTQRARLL
jgi:hypothetical protein